MVFPTWYDWELKSLSCGAREVSSPCAWRGGVRHFSPVMVGESGLKTREGLARFFSGYGRKPWVPSTYARDLRELFRVPLRSQGYCAVGRGRSELHWVWCSRRGPYLELRQEPQGSSPFLIPIAAPCIVGRGESGLVLCAGMDLRLPLELFTG